MKFKHFALLLVVFSFFAPAKSSAHLFEREGDLMEDLLIVDYWNQRINEKMPIFYNNTLQGGYINMPSARMGREGELSIGGSWVPPYHNWNARCQLIDRLEVTANYRVFRGVDDPVLSQFGFGDFSDKGANLKFALFHPEDSEYKIPGVAVGIDDFLGTRAFKARYIVLTQVLLKQNLEFSLGYGEWRIRGFFGGVQWMPFRQSCNPFLENLALVAEYDAIPYKSKKREPHPDGRVKKWDFNLGVKYRIAEYFDFAASYVRGDAFAFSASTYYNLGESKGFVPKIDNPLPYVSPKNTEPLGPLRPENVMIQDLNYAFLNQGIEILKASLSYDCEKRKLLRLAIYNDTYRTELDLRNRINHLLAALIPNDIDTVIVVIESDGFPIQEYVYRMEFVRLYADQQMGTHELAIISPIREVSRECPYTACTLFKKNREWTNFFVLPDFNSFFGSSTGKFKYAVGLTAGSEAYLWNDYYYSARLGYLIYSDIQNLGDSDRLNPSQLINVRTDLINYLKQPGLTFPELYIQRAWNMKNGWYARLSLGWFECQYGGIGTEFLYYPTNSNWAAGFEGAVLKKRTTNGLGFTDKIRKLHGFTPTYQYFLGTQWFFNYYYDWKEICLEFKLKFGQFLARDIGARYEISRYFKSGLKVTFWYTQTNGNDIINGEVYYDKGIMLSMPLDVFYTHSSRERWEYGMSAWLRDVGFSAYNGRDLYNLINEQRQ